MGQGCKTLVQFNGQGSRPNGSAGLGLPCKALQIIKNALASAVQQVLGQDMVGLSHANINHSAKRFYNQHLKSEQEGDCVSGQGTTHQAF